VLLLAQLHPGAYEQLRNENHSFAGVIAVSGTNALKLRVNQEAEAADCQYVSGNYYTDLPGMTWYADKAGSDDGLGNSKDNTLSNSSLDLRIGVDIVKSLGYILLTY
jgi:hypothetical protein